MNLDTARRKIKSMCGLPLHFVYKGSRNQLEEFDGVIVQCFPSVFIIHVNNNTIKSFSYNDYIMKNIVLH